MAIFSDYLADILRHKKDGYVVASNLCNEYSHCEYPHSDPVLLNGVSEPRKLGDGTGPALCGICGKHCDSVESHKEFKLFAGSVALLGGSTDRRTREKKLYRLRLWRLLKQFGLTAYFLADDDDDESETLKTERRSYD